jgi:hypothetical protein
LIAALKPARRGSFHAEFIANAKAEEEEENGAEDGLNGAEDFQERGQMFDRGGVEKILAEAEDVERVGNAQS